MEWLFAPFEVAFVQRALWGGLLVSCVCALAGTWVVVRGMAFLGDAMAHGMLPGVAVASLVGGNLLLGAAISCAAMALGVSALGRNRRLSADTGIGLLFVGMLATGVIIVSRSQSFAVDLTGFLFGDVLAVRERDLVYLLVALAIAALITVLGHRAFVALSFDARKAHTLGLRPRLAHAALVGLVTLAIVASFHIVGTLLVFGLLIAPPAAATYWANRIPMVMVLAAVLGSVATVAGLVISWHAGTAGGATIAAVAVALFFVSALAAMLRDRLRSKGFRTAAVAASALAVIPLAGCGTSAETAAPVETPHGYVAGAEETGEPQSRLILADEGAIKVLDLTTEKFVDAGQAEGVRGIVGDGRYGYVRLGNSTQVVDSGGWMVDHGDHVHYYRAPVRAVGTLAGRVVQAHSDPVLTALLLEDGDTVLLDRRALDEGSIVERGRITAGAALPYAGHVLVTAGDKVEVRTRDNAVVTTIAEPCADPRGRAVTRRGVVFGCADGALVVTGQDGGFIGQKIPYPREVAADRAVEFTHRPGSATLTARAGERGVWTLDVRKKSWALAPVGPVVAVNTAGEGATVLALTRDGVLHSFDPETARETAQVALLEPLADGVAAPSILVDSQRAYVNDRPRGKVYEIAYNDNLRLARTFTTDLAPTHMVETGE
ncbi:ABC-type Mn2+/Zn2+ transport system permease subunit [Nocardia tenerifensis]|uniref:ABC-type Mn2+/Zn2+ transport system permease subunit n=1 Tax=Nocardia tenerifensis TaxID=228006 RepID=A0A318JQV8_9NOCA|nr:zinc ABC transporter permease AztB [Nocardia tenerifensis]PXX58074.1 ABC-type Mn2+/Zn2+ transport system permease subunit [Nocardia tenerifensis]